MASLRAGDAVLSDLDAISRVVVNQHAAQTAHASAMVRIDYGVGLLELTPDHVIKADGEFVAAREVEAGSMLGEYEVMAVTRGVAEVINPITVAGTILAAGKEGKPVVASVYPEWVASRMLSSAVPLPLSLSNLLAYLFPETAQAFYDGLVEPIFPASGGYRSYLEAVPPALSPLAFVAGDVAVSSAFFLVALGPVAVSAVAIASAAAAASK